MPRWTSRFWLLRSRRGAEELAAAKLQTQAIENQFRDLASGGRPVNLDPGTFDTLKVVFASTINV